jgi:hypothetical protein
MKDGHAIHGSYEVKHLGKPASHGCVRISPQNAATLYSLVAKAGLKNTQALASQYRDEARQRAKQLEPIFREMQGKGYSMRRMATELTKRKVKTPRGGMWHPQTVKMVMQRLAA